MYIKSFRHESNSIIFACQTEWNPYKIFFYCQECYFHDEIIKSWAWTSDDDDSTNFRMCHEIFYMKVFIFHSTLYFILIYLLFWKELDNVESNYNVFCYQIKYF